MDDVITYIPSLTSVRIFGIKLTDFDENNIVSIEPIERTTTYKKSMDGHRTLIIDSHPTYRVTVTLMQNSTTNTWIHLLYKLYQSIGGDLRMPLDITYKGVTTFVTMDAFFEDEAPFHYTKSYESLTWSFLCHDSSYNITGLGDNNESIMKIQQLVRTLESVGMFTSDLTNMVDVTERMIRTTTSEIMEMFWW